MKHKLVRPARFDLLPQGHIFTPEGLLSVNPTKLVNATRQDILRAGGRPEDGWLHASVHGEQDLSTGNVQLHYHGTAQGGLLSAIQRLKSQRKYAHPRAVHITRKPLTDLPRPLTYSRQSWWPARDRSLANPPRGRMTEPGHSLVLLWIDSWSVGSLELMMGLRVIGGRLVVR